MMQIREMMLASAFLLFQTMWFWSWCKDDIFTDLRTLFINNNFSWFDWLVEDQNQFVTLALFPLWRFLCLLIDFMQSVQWDKVCPPSPKVWPRSGDPLQNIDHFLSSKSELQRKGSKTVSTLTALLRPTLLCYLNYETESSIFLCNQLLIPIAPMSEYWYRPKLSNWSDIKGLMLHLYKCYAAGICGSWTFCFVLGHSKTLYPYQKSFLMAG